MRLTRWLAGIGWLVLGLAVADWWALRRGALQHPPTLLAAAVVVVIVCFCLRMGAVARRLAANRQRPVARLAELTMLAGIVLALLGGTANWLLRLQGTVILNEGEAVPLYGGTALQAFDSGVFADVRETGVTLLLEKLELEAAGDDVYYPRSLLRVWTEPEKAEELEVTPQQRGEFGVLRFHQGAFGFSPRIVVLDDDRMVFDRVVPFLSERLADRGVAFDGRFSVEAENLEVEGTIDLASLDEAMRGHATLHLALEVDGELLGRGSLLPGYFADLDRGYRVGFAGLERWSEIVISRRNYGRFVQAGSMIAVVGLMMWPVAVWRKW